MEEWKFDQAPNCAVFTLRQIIDGSIPVLHVSHDADDHGWQFLSLETPREEDAAIVGLSEILEMDPSLQELFDLPPGWRAWRRSIQDPWAREPV
jgi:hypothetical protein